MGETTGIAWTDSTINVWHGCDKVSAGCKHCYAEVSTPVRVKRAKGLEVWGRDAARDETRSWEANLRKWNREAAASGKVHRVFGQSLSDTFEDYRDGRVVRARERDDLSLFALRAAFFEVVEQCTALTFQLLTKRPENVLRMVPPSWLKAWPAHVWIGCTVEDQENADRRIPHLLRVPAAVRFLSVEPQIGPVDLCRAGAMSIGAATRCGCGSSLPARECHEQTWSQIHWVIQGGESGTKARPFDLAWARSLRNQCRAARVAYFLKQLGAQPVVSCGQPCDDCPVSVHWVRDSHGGDESEWPADLRGCRAFPEAP